MGNRERPIRLPRNYIVLWFMLWLLYKTYRKPEPELISVVYFVIIMFLLCECYITYIKTKVHLVATSLPEHVNKGEKVTFKVTVINHSFLPAPFMYIFLKESYHIKPEKIRCLCVSLPPHGQKDFTFQLEAIYSGKEEIGIDKVIITDFLELARRKLNYSWLQEIIILPQPFKMKEANYLLDACTMTKDEQLDAKRTALMEEGEISYELKPYVEGQSQRLIHWKLVAQRDIYMVREREQVLKLRKERLVVIDPSVKVEEVKVEGLERLMFWRHEQRRHIEGKQKAQVIDKLVNGSTSYLLEILRLGESILLFYYDKGKWQQVRLVVRQDLEKISDKLSGCIVDKGEKMQVRWPQVPTKGYAQRILISASVDASLREAIEEETGLKVLELQKRSVLHEQEWNKYWYLTDDYQIVRNG